MNAYIYDMVFRCLAIETENIPTMKMYSILNIICE